jgi:aryl-alcohol dehydrogenase-like predicted oxidoreductase
MPPAEGFCLVANKLISEFSQDETSEQFIGEWAEKRGIRDQLVIATKASPDFPSIERPYKLMDVIGSIQATSSGDRIKSLTR